jgi:hypothetical protein
LVKDLTAIKESSANWGDKLLNRRIAVNLLNEILEANKLYSAVPKKLMLLRCTGK